MNRYNKKINVKLLSIFLSIAIVMVGIGTPIEVSAAKRPSICTAKEWDVLKRVNKERMKKKLQPLATFKKFQSAADVRVSEVTSYFSHTRPNGSSCFTIFKEKKIPYVMAGENIAAGYRTSADVMKGWMNSPGHKQNILKSEFTHMGVGYTKGGSYGTGWVQLFVGENVNKPTVSGLKLSKKGTIKAKRGTSIEKMNLYLTYKSKSYGTCYVPLLDKMCKGYKKTKKGTQTVKAVYQGRTIKFKVKLS